MDTAHNARRKKARNLSLKSKCIKRKKLGREIYNNSLMNSKKIRRDYDDKEMKRGKGYLHGCMNWVNLKSLVNDNICQLPYQSQQ